MTRSSCWKRSSVPTGPPLTGTLALHDAGRRSESNEEDRYMTESDMADAKGEIGAIYRGGVRYAEV